MNGVELRAKRLFNADTGRSYIVAVDHGLSMGAKPGAEDAIAAVEKSLAGEPDGVLIAPGLLARTAHLFGRRGAPSPIVRADFLANDPMLEHYGDLHRVICTAREAVALGGDAMIMYFVFGAADGATFADNLTAIGRAAAEAHALGLPMIAEVVAWGSQAPDRRDPDLLTFGCRMAAELGADLIKTEYTGSPESMRTVIAGCPAPVMVLGGARLDSPEALYDLTRDALGAGAVGVVYGRNIWQADDPAKVGAAVRSIVHGQG
jgi:DhnA family fructose-bisphosphate aldolase class Ia